MNAHGEWRPDWPKILWVVPAALFVASPVVARMTYGDDCSRHLSAAVWAIVAFAAGVTALLTYAFSRQWGGARIFVAALAGGLVFALDLGVSAMFALVGGACD